MINLLETPDSITQEMLKQVRDFCTHFITPLAADVDQKNVIDREVWRSMGKMGLLGISVDQIIGGGGMSAYEQCLVVEELAASSPGIALSYLAHTCSCIEHIKNYGSDAQRKVFLPKLIRGELLGATAIAESTKLAQRHQISCAATLSKNRYLINGEKFWVVNGVNADLFVVYVRTDEERYDNNVSAVIVPGDARGVVRHKRIETMGMRGSGICDISFKNCLVPIEHTIGPIGEGLRLMEDSHSREMIFKAAAPLGVIRMALNQIVPEIRTHIENHSELASDIAQRIADIYTRYRSTQALVQSLATQLESGAKPPAYDAQTALSLACLQASDSVMSALELSGLDNYLASNTTMRSLRDANYFTMGMGNQAEYRMQIGQELIERLAEGYASDGAGDEEVASAEPS